MAENDINTHVILVMGIVQKGNKFLLAKRSSKDPQAGGEWAIPGGKVDLETGPEVIEKTLKRELLEEVGVEIMDEIKFVCDDAFVRVSGHHVVGLVFL
ncbi:NUDIX domain-containing protein [Candidatus Microgenomates bacterium]|nr:NUDIX domain-containing protein [Candidatus Microgenomates bacterium]